MLKFCDCKEDRFCQRYQRQMSGRMRELCAGVNVDIGTAAAFREQWAREAGGTLSSMRDNVVEPYPLLLDNKQAPGDAVAMTAAIYSLHRAHPGKYTTAIDTPWPEVFAHNPDVVSAGSVPGASAVSMHYPAVHRSNERGIHFMQGWCEHLSAVLGVHVPLLTNRPHLYFSDPAPPVGDFWLICSGGKTDFTAKSWGHHNYQEVVGDLVGQVKFVQVGAAEDNHPRLAGAHDMVGKTTLRSLFEWTRLARGVVCGVSLLMHVAAALEKPVIVIAGGREPVQWNSYPKQQYLHTVGALPCCSTQGVAGAACWRSRVVPVGDGSVFDKDTCQRPVNGTPTKLTYCTVPECMALIRPAEVVELVLRYNKCYEQTQSRQATTRGGCLATARLAT